MTKPWPIHLAADKFMEHIDVTPSGADYDDLIKALEDAIDIYIEQSNQTIVLER